MNDRRARNRALMPETASIIDDLRKHLGANCIQWARFEENGQTVEWGTRDPVIGKPYVAAVPHRTK